MTDRELDRRAAHRLAVIRHAQEVTGNVRKTCRYYGITRQAYYKWLRRYEDGGLDALRDGSSRPHVSPNATQAEVVGKIVYLRQTYHFGPHKIAMYLERYHQIAAQPVGRVADPQPPRHEPAPGVPAVPSPSRTAGSGTRSRCRGHRVQIDVKFIARCRLAARSYYQFTAIDDCTRIRVLRAYDRLQPDDGDPVPRRGPGGLPFRVETIQTDNGAEFQSRFHYHVLDRGIGHVYIRPATPRLNGKVERSHRIDADEFYKLLEGIVIDDSGLFTERLREWEDYYNFDRPHGGLGGQTPYERLRLKTGVTV